MSNPDLYGLIGWPVAQSLSPFIHNGWYKDLGISAHYDLYPIYPQNFEAELQAVLGKGVKGFNITVPHKQAIIPYLDEVSSIADAIGAVNTVSVQDGKLIGTNTDAYGFIQNLRMSAPDWDAKDARVLILGSGGAARAALAAFNDEAVASIEITNRNDNRATDLAAEFACKTIPWDERDQNLNRYNMIVQTTSCGMVGKDALGFSLDGYSKDGIVYDIVYNPLFTTLLQDAKAQGCKYVTGIGMLLYQAQRAFEIWTDQTPIISDSLVADCLKKIQG